jgi:FlaG/FlaF family flagellin (archaellin)
MKSTFLQGLTGSMVALLAAMALMLAIQGYKALVPAQVEHNTSNITQGDFDQSLAKWTGQKVGTYEMTIVDPRQELRLRVDTTTNKLYMLSHTVNGISESVDGLKVALTGVAAKTFEAYTVASMFETIRSDMAATVLGAGAPTGSDTTRFVDLNVQFDPAAGYPVHIVEHSRTTLNTNEITWRATSKDVQIKDFTVIQ